jgi:hypothetical protein
MEEAAFRQAVAGMCDILLSGDENRIKALIAYLEESMRDSG